MLLPKRHGSVDSYRYGFNGMEKDDEISGEGNSYTTYFRQFDLRTGRTFSLDPIQRAGQTMYSMMSNNPIVMIDPRGDDDYYNERGVYLYSDTRNSNDIRLITQKQFNEIQQNYSSQIADKNSSYRDLIEKLDTESRLVTNKVSGNQLKKIWDDSRPNQPIVDANPDMPGYQYEETNPERRREQSAVMIFDVENAEIRLLQESDEFNTHTESGRSEDLTVEGGITYYKGNKNFVVIASIHTHVDKMKEVIVYGGGALILNGDPLPYSSSSSDAKMSNDKNIPIYQIDPYQGGLHMQRENKSKSRFISPESDLYKDLFDIVRDALKEVNKIRNEKPTKG